VALAQVYTAEAIKTLGDVMRSSDSHAARVAAADKLLDRGHGRAPQTMTLDATVRRDPSEISDAELAAIIATATARDQPDSVH